MQIFHKLDEIPADFGPSLVSVGNFDGVHRAHVRVLNEIVARSRQRHARSVAVTFDPHPMRILRPDAGLKLLTPEPEKIRLLEETGIDAMVVIPFSRDLSLMSPREFVKLILCDRLHAVEVHEGYNFRFGHKAAGDVTLLTQLGAECGFEVITYPELRLRGETVSSTRIRQLIQAGDIRRARFLLGRPFSIQSTAGRGRGYGSKYTVPTINLSRYEELAPRDGVYITQTRVAAECFNSVTNVGNRPTFGSDSFAIESHLLNFHPLEITADSEIEISFLSRVRDEIKFGSVEELRQQIQRDVARAERYFRLMGRKELAADC
ncbi:MAG TPA: bifunctional riboflavin kinase/FAD synthetase [Terriglobales bacterium]|jgi:riboflavin kinase / FMN adenylyltransferase|nr:bifunctional riboflavin kinase/FAD synthetase [Terriglobales bacterium]